MNIVYILAEYSVIFIFGALIGNFATTLLYRLPRGIMLYGLDKANSKAPFCSMCSHALRFYEYLPIIGWISTKGRCNYCNARIPLSYIGLELSGGFFAILCAFLYRENIENYIIIFAFLITATLALQIKYEKQVIPKIITGILIFEGILYSTLNDGSILPWLMLLCIAGIASIYIMRHKSHEEERQELIHIILPLSVWLQGVDLLATVFGLALLFLMSCFWKRMNLYYIGMIWLMLMTLATTGNLLF